MYSSMITVVEFRAKKVQGGEICPLIKEIVERRHGEPVEFIFLPKMGLLAARPVMKKIAGCEL